jgi:hypothetical protein
LPFLSFSRGCREESRKRRRGTLRAPETREGDRTKTDHFIAVVATYLSVLPQAIRYLIAERRAAESAETLFVADGRQNAIVCWSLDSNIVSRAIAIRCSANIVDLSATSNQIIERLRRQSSLQLSEAGMES